MTDSAPIIYEQPLNERIRLFLRFEDLLDRFEQAHDHPARWSTHCAIATLAELQSLVSRDIKRDLLKEIERVNAYLANLADQPGVDEEMLANITDRLRHSCESLHGLTGQPDQPLIDNEFFSGIKQRISITGGTCGFDLPAYHYWRHRPYEERRALLDGWIAPFRCVGEAIGVLLDLVRSCAPPRIVRAEGGYFEKALDSSLSWQMIRIELDPTIALLPEISAGKHRFTIRFLDPGDLSTRPRPGERDVEFALACCAL